MKVLIVHYTLFGHTHFLAEAVEKGASEVDGIVVEMRRVPETLSWEEIEQRGAGKFQRSFMDVPICSMDDLKDADAIFFGAPTYFGSMCSQMQQFLESLGKLWSDGVLTGKLGSAFTSSASQHGGQEAALLGIYKSLLHLGMIVVGLPYTFQEQMRTDEITGGSPYGATTITGHKGERMPSNNELDGAYFQGRHVAMIASKLAKR
jgi:NAD(P)H dehydrogenase (quinone)